MAEQYGKMRASTMRLIMDASQRGRSSLWTLLVSEITPLFRDGDQLGRMEAGWLAVWLEEIGRSDLRPEDVQTVQIPRDWAAGVLGGYAANASRALTAMQVAGILTPIRKGIKGHASLYCVNPIPSRDGDTLTPDTGKCEGKYPNSSEKYPNSSGEIP